MADTKLIDAMASAILDSINESCDIVPSEAMTAAQAAHASVVAHATSEEAVERAERAYAARYKGRMKAALVAALESNEHD
jgi:hypothetical protein